MISHILTSTMEDKVASCEYTDEDQLLAEETGPALNMCGMLIRRTVRLTVDVDYWYRVAIIDVDAGTGAKEMEVGRRFRHLALAVELFNECIDTLNNFNR